MLRRIDRSRSDAVRGAGVPLGELRASGDDEAGLLMVLVPNVHLGAAVDRHLGQGESESVVSHQEALRTPPVAAHVELAAFDLAEGPNDHVLPLNSSGMVAISRSYRWMAMPGGPNALLTGRQYHQ